MVCLLRDLKSVDCGAGDLGCSSCSLGVGPQNLWMTLLAHGLAAEFYQPSLILGLFLQRQQREQISCFMIDYCWQTYQAAAESAVNSTIKQKIGFALVLTTPIAIKIAARHITFEFNLHSVELS